MKENVTANDSKENKNCSGKEFGSLRSLLFPIHGYEVKKLLPLSLIFLAVSMTYTMLRGLKDIYIYRYMRSESIYFLKILVIPSIVLFTFFYTIVTKKFEDKYTRFNIVFGYFLTFLLIFTFILLPFVDFFRLDSIADSLTNISPRLKNFWNIIRVWPISLLYIHAEAYGTMALGVAFWTFANSIFSSSQATRMYGFLSSGAALGALLSGVVMLKLSKNANFMFVVGICSLLFIIVLFNYLVMKIKADPESYGIEEGGAKKVKTKVKMSLLESIKRIIQSRYLSFITLIVLGYNMFIALLESIWKNRVDIYKSQVVDNYLLDNGYDPADIATIANDESFKAVKTLAVNAGTEATSVIYAWQSICTGLFSLFLIFFVASTMRKKSWKIRALFTPIVALTLSAMFYIFFKKMDILLPVAEYFDKALLLIFIFFGMGILVFIKSSKYIFFDTSKEQAYIPLDESEKVNAKAAIDAIGSRLGKGFSSILISVLGVIFGGLSAISNMTFIIIFVIISIWLFAVIGLNPLYEKKLIERENEKLAAQQSEKVEVDVKTSNEANDDIKKGKTASNSTSKIKKTNSVSEDVSVKESDDASSSKNKE